MDFFKNVWLPMKLEISFSICALHMLHLAAPLKPQTYRTCISLLLRTHWYIILYVVCGAEKAEKKINKMFYKVCNIFYKMSMLNQLLFHPLCYWVTLLGIKNQKQVLNVCDFLAGLSTARNWCDNQQGKCMCMRCGLFPNYYLINATNT